MLACWGGAFPRIERTLAAFERDRLTIDLYEIAKLIGHLADVIEISYARIRDSWRRRRRRIGSLAGDIMFVCSLDLIIFHNDQLSHGVYPLFRSIVSPMIGIACPESSILNSTADLIVKALSVISMKLPVLSVILIPSLLITIWLPLVASNSMTISSSSLSSN